MMPDDTTRVIGEYACVTVMVDEYFPYPVAAIGNGSTYRFTPGELRQIADEVEEAFEGDRFIGVSCPECGRPTVVDTRHSEQRCDWVDDTDRQERSAGPSRRSSSVDEDDERADEYEEEPCGVLFDISRVSVD